MFEFDEALYLKLYPDVSEAVGRGDFKAGLEHYLRFGKSEGRIDTVHELVARIDRRRQQMEESLDEKERLIAQLSLSLTEVEDDVRALRASLDECYTSTSWRVSAPIRYVGRCVNGHRLSTLYNKAKDLWRVYRGMTERHSLAVFVRKSLWVLRYEGFSGIRSRVRQQHIFLTLARPAALQSACWIAPSPVVRRPYLLRDADGRYLLGSVPASYTYINPMCPADFDRRIARCKPGTLFSIVVPIYNTTSELLDAMVGSVVCQWYKSWELVLVDDCSTSEETKSALGRLNHPNIKVIYADQNGGISAATNIGISKSSGDYVVFLDHDDELTPDCLYELAICINREDADFIYSDEDKLSIEGLYYEPHYKPDWSPDTMMSTMYTCHVSCVRRSLLNEIGGLRSEYDGCQDWDMVLRVTERTDRISHIPKVLYHWRVIPASVASNLSAKPYVFDASRKAREDALKRRGVRAHLEVLEAVPGYHRVVYELEDDPLVSVIIPSRDNGSVLKRCIDSIFEKTHYANYEIVILDNGSVLPETLAYLDRLRADVRVKIVPHDAPFNYSELNNIGVRNAAGELLLFLNDDTEILQADWLARLGGFAQQKHVGAVGAKLLYPDGSIQHAGVLNLQDGPGHAFLRSSADSHGYFLRNQIEYNWLAVTGACLMVARDKFELVGGFAEDLPVAYNDIDICMRIHDHGFYNVMCQAVRLVHHESISRGIDHLDAEKIARLKRDKEKLYARNPKYYQYDPFFNVNLHANGTFFEVPV